jgi:Papain-like cysteine protease AvrRpt2
MINYELNPALMHKKQTKANDCWYASVQMLKSYRFGVKTKPVGTHTMHLHKGLLGHRLHADSKVSKHFAGVLQENNLRCLDTNRFLLSSPGMVEECLREFGPIAILGNFGQVGPIRGLGHFVVLAGIKEDAVGIGTRKFKIHDPAKSVGGWEPAKFYIDNWGGDDESAIVYAA